METLTTLKELLAHQYEAALTTLGLCIDRCPEELWHGKVGNRSMCQVAFHTLFFADYYLGENEAAQLEQAYHKERAAVFRDYEELQPRVPVLLYERGDVVDYLQFCLAKAERTVMRESEEVLAGPCNFPRKSFSRAELHVYNIRHIQHHAAQMSLRLRLDAGVEIPWVRSRGE